MSIERDEYRAANVALDRVARSFAAHGWWSMMLAPVSSKIAHIHDGIHGWYAPIREITEIGERPEDDYAASVAYAAWCSSHTALRLSEIPPCAQRVARLMDWV